MKRFLSRIAEVRLPRGKQISRTLLLWSISCFSAASSQSDIFEKLVISDVNSFFQKRGHAIEKVDVDVKLPHRLEQSSCTDMQVRRRSADTAPIKKVRYEIECEGETSYRGYANIKVWTPALVAKRQINVGEYISPSMLTSASTEISVLRGGFLTRASQIEGYRVKRKIKQHQAITFSYLSAPDLVVRGEIVTLQAEGTGFVASVKVEALEDGKLGESIKVRNLSSEKIIQAKVIGENLVKSEN
ncbi:flagellar basal body P-ring formation chaperone FlgA [Alteromonas sp. S015]|uniref:flagellar basal body P-ring formation chaperone FlgA n=1 Tax=Alteromonas sp. S015 TaxID=3117401 RepID=UPI002FE1E61F